MSSTQTYFFETHRHGKWCPQMWTYKPTFKKVNGHLVLVVSDGIGPKVRGLRIVPVALLGQTLLKVANQLSVDGSAYSPPSAEEQADLSKKATAQ